MDLTSKVLVKAFEAVVSVTNQADFLTKESPSTETKEVVNETPNH